MSRSELTLDDVIHTVTTNAVDNQQANGAMPAGHNGPWGHEETPVRNTGHWLITFLHVYEQTGDTRFQEAAIDAVDYLLSDEARPHGYTFHHLRGDDASSPNGLVGQAWTIEALATAADALDRPELSELAAEVFLSHPFDETLAAWNVVDITGDRLGFDLTFNHQLWFAAAGGLLSRQASVPAAVGDRVTHFLDEVETTLTVDEDGIIQHPFKPDFQPLKYAKIGFDAIRTGDAVKLVRGALQSEVGDGMSDRAVGYQSFNLYGFALLAEQFPDHQLWKSQPMTEALSAVDTTQFKNRLDQNPYGYPYNVSGFEFAYVEDVFGSSDSDKKTEWVTQQLRRTYDPNTETLSINTPDPVTLTARIYEATRIEDVQINEDAIQ